MEEGSGDNLMGGSGGVDGGVGGGGIGGSGIRGGAGAGGIGVTNCSASLEETIPNFLEQVSSSYSPEP